MTTGTACPCGSGATFDACCGPWLAGAPAPTAEALMRSRYTAFVRGDGAYIDRTYAPEKRKGADGPLPDVTWTGLEILGSTGGGAHDLTGTVDFAASFLRNGMPGTHRENSTFRREADGCWVYVDGLPAGPAPTGKTGRNDPCPCGSGRKYKRCCGA